ncbi:uncharacterized protein LOC120474272 [Pimephales promelas]|uniref:uncharacterized protein LOC120474272 n=1 Tax=Pimephales promelas TaxID=90988 RepID=UPI001955D8A1|nr:uncharacterized protein LOC120474272 [Pimephales promelas]
MKNVIVIILLSFLMNGVFGADEMKVTDGDSLTLPTGLTEIQSSDRILWLYGSDRTIIAKIDAGTNNTDNDDERFQGNLELDKQTGSLTIKNVKIKNSGYYQLDIKRGSTIKDFNVKVYAILPTPDIDSQHCAQTPVGSSSPRCVFQCSVQTSDQTTLFWYRGNSVISSKISDICSRLSLRLEVNYEDKNIYSCMVKNPITNKTKHLDVTQLCQPCAAVPSSGLPPGAIVGIVVLAVAVAVVAAVIYKRNRIPERQKQIDKIGPEPVKCRKGRCAVLRSDHDIKRGDKMLFTHVSCKKESAIASISENDKKTYWYDRRFRGRLQLDPRTGSLIIRNLRKTDAGVYVLEIKTRGGTIYRKYEVILFGEVKTVSVKEKDNVKLDFSEKMEISIKWEFGEEKGFIASLIKKDNPNDKVEAEYSGERFRDNLQLDMKNGYLTINNIRTEHTGLYTVKSNPGYNFSKSFNVVFDDFTETAGNESVNTGFTGQILKCCRLERIGGVFGDEKDEMKTLSVKEGGDLNLNTETEIQTDDEIIVRFGTALGKRRPYVTIARISKPGGDDDFKSAERFKDRLLLDLTEHLTITIRDFKITDYGDYYIQITNKEKKSFKSFTFIVVPSDEAVKTVSVIKEKPIKLNPDIPKLQENEQVLWTFGPYGMIIADTTNPSRCDKRFRGRLALDKKTGSLTIRESTTEDTGIYQHLIIGGNRIRNQRFNVTVKEDASSEQIPDEDEGSALRKFLDEIELEAEHSL